MTIEEKQKRINIIASELALVAASSRDGYEIIAARTYALLDQLADLVAGFPKGALMRRGVECMAASVAVVIDNPPKGQSVRVALQEHVAALAAAFAKVQP
jgi:hypothetical protein